MTTMATIGYGNIISDTRGIIFTSMNAVESTIECMNDILSVMVEDMSKLTGIPVEILLSDYINETGHNIMHESIKAVTNINEPTITRKRINKIIGENV